MQELLSISVLIFLAAISPGPDFAVVVKNSLMYSRRAGVYTAAGVSASILIHAIYCVFGLAIVISQSLLAFRMIKILGAAYLIYIGVKSLLSKREERNYNWRHTSCSISAMQVFTQGFLCNLLNPKAILFLLAFFTLVVKPGHPVLVEMGFALEISLIHMAWFSWLAYMMSHAAVQKNLSQVQFYIVKTMGVILIAFGLRIATLSHSVLVNSVMMQ